MIVLEADGTRSTDIWSESHNGSGWNWRCRGCDMSDVNSRTPSTIAPETEKKRRDPLDEVAAYTYQEPDPELLPDPTYMAHMQTDITPAIRRQLVEWLYQVGCELGFHQETLHLSVNYIDRILSRVPIARSRLQLLGITCAFIACKLEEYAPPSTHVMEAMCAGAASIQDILTMERIVLTHLNFRLAALPLAVSARATLITLGADDGHGTARFLADFLSDVLLAEYGSLYFNLQQLGASISVIAHCMSLGGGASCCGCVACNAVRVAANISANHMQAWHVCIHFVVRCWQTELERETRSPTFARYSKHPTLSWMLVQLPFRAWSPSSHGCSNNSEPLLTQSR